MSRKDLGTNLAVALTDAGACGKNQPFTLVGGRARGRREVHSPGD